MFFNSIMKKIVLPFLIVYLSINISYSQVFINELDADTPGTDNFEFIELKSSIPNFSLDGYVLVFFNGLTTGTGTSSYYAIDLDTYSTDINGIIHFGNSQVSPTPAFIFPNSTIQNGPDAVALYQGNASDFPINTLATNVGLIDFLCYTNSTTVNPTGLMNVFNNTTVCVYDNQSLYTASKSIQRKVDGTYEVKTPTPGMNNDGSGVLLTYLTMTVGATTLNEGNVLNISFTTTQAVTNNDLIINFSLENGNFNTLDYTGLTSVTIPIGMTTGTATIQLLDDSINDGDEELKITVNNLQSGYSLYNNNIIVRVLDVNFTTLPFGTPSNPTYGTILSTAPAGYYNSIEGLSGAALKQELQNIIANPSVVRAHSYADVVEILKTADQNPENNNQVWLIYNEIPRTKLDYQTTSSIIGKWNREHIYCQSRGNFGDFYNTPADGIGIWLSTNANDIAAGLSDAHHIRAVDGQENSSRNNRNYGIDYNGPAGAPSSWKGDVARAIFYMAVRYNGLNVVNGNPADSTLGQIGDLATLLSWNQTDKSDDFEMNRNNYIYTWQQNRNPFIDYPLLAEYIWGSHAGEVWHSTLSNFQENNTDNEFSIYPNPASYGIIYINTKKTIERLYITSINGQLIYEDNTPSKTNEFYKIENLPKGFYFLQISSSNNTITKKILVN